jgi:multidrug efflux pump subunit AcrA (membrane-fusion protein)
MTFDIEINGRARTVSVERAVAGCYRVIVDGHAHVVDAARIGSFGLSLLMGGDGGVSREVHVSPGSAPGEMLVRLEGLSVTALVDGRRTGRASADGGTHARGEQAVVAPMPGRVVRLLVARGDDVTARQSVVVVEAMKMENELRSPKAGRVKEVAVTAGASVEAGRVLLVIE